MADISDDGAGISPPMTPRIQAMDVIAISNRWRDAWWGRLGRLRTPARFLDNWRHRPDWRQPHVAPGKLERFNESLEGGKPQILVGEQRDRAARSMVGRIERDALERAFHQERGQCRHEAHTKSRAHQPERH